MYVCMFCVLCMYMFHMCVYICLKYLKPTPRCILKILKTDVQTKTCTWGLPWWSSGWDSTLQVQGSQVHTLVRELDPTCRN